MKVGKRGVAAALLVLSAACTGGDAIPDEPVEDLPPGEERPARDGVGDPTDDLETPRTPYGPTEPPVGAEEPHREAPE